MEIFISGLTVLLSTFGYFLVMLGMLVLSIIILVIIDVAIASDNRSDDEDDP